MKSRYYVCIDLYVSVFYFQLVNQVTDFDDACVSLKVILLFLALLYSW